MKATWLRFAGIACAFGLLLAANNAAATTISEIGDSGGNPGGLPLFQATGLQEGDGLNISWFFFDEEFEGTVSAEGMLVVTSLNDEAAILDVMIENTSPDESSRLTSFGISVDGVSGGGGSAGTFLTTIEVPPTPGFSGFDVNACAFVNNCPGGGNGGIPGGEIDAFQITVTGLFNPTEGLTISQFAAQFQTDIGPDGESYQIAGEISEKGPGINVPAPSTLWLLGAAAFGAGAAFRRRRRA